MQTLNSTIQRGATGGTLVRGTSRGRGRAQNRTRGAATDTSRPRLTHFLAIPLGHLPHLRTRVSAFTTSLLAADPPIAGLDESLVIPARRLHLTLGVMSLTDSADAAAAAGAPPTGAGKTPAAALALLTALEPRLRAITAGQPLRVPLEIVDTMRPPRAHVLFAGPDPDAEHNRTLQAFCELIHDEFVKAGLVEDEHRALKLHCTLLNTVYRRPRARGGQRTPFDVAAVLASDAFQRIASAQKAAGSGDAGRPHERAPAADGTPRPPALAQSRRAARGAQAHRVDLGSYVVDEVQVCLMGSSGPEGEYVSVGNIRLV